MSKLLLKIPGNPIAKKRPRFARRGKFVTTYNDQQTEEGKFICLMQSQLNGHKPIPAGTPVNLHLNFFMPIPKAIEKKILKQRIEHTKKPDVDNMIKFVKDCANGIIWHDDSQVIYVTARKDYDSRPRTEITVRWDEKKQGIGL